MRLICIIVGLISMLGCTMRSPKVVQLDIYASVACGTCTDLLNQLWDRKDYAGADRVRIIVRDGGEADVATMRARIPANCLNRVDVIPDADRALFHKRAEKGIPRMVLYVNSSEVGEWIGKNKENLPNIYEMTKKYHG